MGLQKKEVASANTHFPADDTPRDPFVQASIWLMDMVADDDSDITWAHAGVYMTIRRHWSPDRPRPWPSLDLIARESGIGLTRVKALLRKLEAVGALRRESRGRKKAAVAAAPTATSWRAWTCRSWSTWVPMRQ